MALSPDRRPGAGRLGIGAFSKTLKSMCQTSESIVEWNSVWAVSAVLEDMGVAPSDALVVSDAAPFGPFAVNGSTVRAVAVSFGSGDASPEGHRIPADHIRIRPPAGQSAVVLSLFKYT